MEEKKHRRSKQRDLIYAYLLSTTEHPSVEMVYEHLRKEIPNISLGTVYRNLKLLEEMGQVRRVMTSQNIERYDARCEDHAHFVCQDCGCVKDLNELDIKVVRDAYPASLKDQVVWANVVFGGTCATCKN